MTPGVILAGISIPANGFSNSFIRETDPSRSSQLEKALGAGFDIATGVMGVIVRTAEEMLMKLLEGRPFESVAPRPGQAAKVGRFFHRADSGKVEKTGRNVHPDKLPADDAEVEVQVVGDERRSRLFDRSKEIRQDALEVLAGANGAGLGYPMDESRVPRDYKSHGANDMTASLQRPAGDIENRPGYLDETRPSRNVLDREMPRGRQTRRFAIDKGEFR